MKSIMIYDIEAKLLDKVANANDMTIADVVEMLCDYIEDMVEDNKMN